MNCRLVLEDGVAFEGRSVGAAGTAMGEVVFSTAMTGYQEMLTDPSYAGQILTLTYPLIGNYGVTKEDFESRKVQAAGFIVKQIADAPSNWRSQGDLRGFLQEGRGWLERMLRSSAGKTSVRRADALTGAGILAEMQGDHRAAMAFHEEGANLHRATGDRRAIKGGFFSDEAVREQDELDRPLSQSTGGAVGQAIGATAASLPLSLGYGAASSAARAVPGSGKSCRCK